MFPEYFCIAYIYENIKIQKNYFHSEILALVIIMPTMYQFIPLMVLAYYTYRFIENRLNERTLKCFLNNTQNIILSEQEFIKIFQRSDDEKCRLLFLHVMNIINVALIEEDICKLERCFKLVRSMLQVISLDRFLSYGRDANNPIFKTNLIILACKYNKRNVLEHLLYNYGSAHPTTISKFVNGEGTLCTSYEVDGAGHNAFYYIMQTCNIDILDRLCFYFRMSYMLHSPQDLNVHISKACEDLKLRGATFPNDMQYHVVQKLMTLKRYFYFPTTCKLSLSNIVVRAESLDRAVFYATDYSDVRDETFLHALKYIARSTHILKRQMKSTYIRLPWEEIEFCCIAFVLSHEKYDERSLIYRSILTRNKLKSYLTEFARELSLVVEEFSLCITSIEKLCFLSSEIKRDAVVNAIKRNTVFKGLYEDFEQIMDVYSLNTINSYVELILSVDPHEENAHLIILRALQVIGEYMKNTLESPKLSNNAIQCLMLSLPENIIKIIVEIRNCLSHANFICKGIELEQIMDVTFISKIQHEIKNLGKVVKDILHKAKISIVIQQLKKVLDTNYMQEITQILEIFKEILYNVETKGMASSFGSYTESWKRIDSFVGLKIMYELTKNKSNKNCMRDIKSLAKNILNNIEQNDSHVLWNSFYGIYLEQSLVQLLVKQSFKCILPQLNTDPRFIKKMMTLFEFADSFGFDFKRITQLRNIVKLSDHDHSKCDLTKGRQDSRKIQLKIKIKALKVILAHAGLMSPVKKISYIKTNKKLLATLEILVLDIMNILCSYGEWTPNDWCYLENRMPLLVGKNLRNHLAHGNIIMEILPFDHEAIVISNARILADECYINVIKRVTKEDPLSTEMKFYEDLGKIYQQSDMYAALREGNLNYFLQCIKNGADLKGKCARSWTVFQYAVIGDNPEILEYLFSQNLQIELKDEINSQSLLHIAVCNQSTLALNYLIERNAFNIDDIDNTGMTPLHFAAQYGFADIVQILLRHKAQISILDARGFLPLHLAVQHCFMEIVRCFLESGNEVDALTKGGFTSLHISAEFGHLQISQFLIENHANINAANETETTPLHLAALKGHVKMVELLISKGADVDALSIINTPLHCAVEEGNTDVVLILLERNADVNITERSNNGTALNLAACMGHKQIVEILLDYRADVSIATKDNWNPLHNAARFGSIDIVRILIAYGSYAHSKSGNGKTALHIAAEYGRDDVVKFLINMVDVDLRDQSNKTPLHLAVENGKSKVVDILIKKGASINCKDIDGSTPLHLSALGGYSEITQKLINQGSNIKSKNNVNKTPLHVAIEEGFEEIVGILMSAEANVNAVDDDGRASIHLSAMHGFTSIAELLISKYDANFKNKDKRGNTPLHLAVEFNHLDVTALLINKGSNVNSKNKSGYTPLYHAIKNNNDKICNLLIKNGASVKGCYEKEPPLHIAILKGSVDLVELLLKHGADIEELRNGRTPLCTAIICNRIEMVEFLLTHNANINFKFIDGTTLLHFAATLGLDNMVHILVSHGANVNTKDVKNRTALEMAVAYNNLPIVKILLHQPHVNINAKGNDDFTMLHIASQLGNLEVVKYLISEGADVHATNNLGSKPIHIATREGFKEVMQYFLDKGLINLYDGGAGGSTLLHYAAIGGKTEIAEYLIKKGFDVNIRNLLGMMAIHQAALENHKPFIELLLHNNATYDALDYCNKRPIDYATNKDIIQLLKSVDKMFEAVRTANWLEIKNCIKYCSSLNARDQDECTLLHIAARTGREKIMKILLDHKIDPNVNGKMNITPLCCAVKSGAINIVKMLLSYGAKYNTVSIEETNNRDIINLLSLIIKSFQKSQNGVCDLIDDLKAIRDPATFKAVVNARNKENKTIFVTAIHNDFPKIDKLKQIIQGDAPAIKKMLQKCDIAVTTNVLRQQTEKFGPDNMCALQIEEELAVTLYSMQKYREALSMCEKIYAKRKELLGLWDKDTLRIRSTMGLILNRQGKNKESLSILEEAYQKQKDILDPGHDDILSTETHMALLLYDLKKYDEALDLNNKVLEKHLKMSRNDDPRMLSVMNNIAMVLNAQGKHEKALESYREVYEKRKTILGPKDHLTLRSLCNMGHVHFSCKRYDEALIILREGFLLQKASLGPNHLDTLNTQNMIGHTLFRQGKYPEALQNFEESFAKRANILGSDHPDVFQTLELINSIKFAMRISGSAESQTLREEINAKDISLAAESGNKRAMELLIQKGVNVNSRDIEGRTALHFAVCKGHKEVIDLLLTNGADCTAATNKGNTALHTACVAGRAEIVNMLLKRLKNTDDLQLSSLVNAKTTVGGMTPLHIAAKSGFEEIVLLLLENGSVYNCEEKQNKTPLDLTSNSNIKYLLQLINELFEDATNGKFMLIDKLQNMDVKYLTAVVNARNHDDCTLLGVSILNKHTDIASLIVKMIK